jgi:dTMP kinase
MKEGKFIVIEGTDGSGKTEQFNALLQKLKKNDLRIETTDFPQYNKPSSYFIKQYLNGFYGDWRDVGARKASLFYALDRYEASFKIREWLKWGKIVLSNRYVGSNLDHQGLKIKDPKERKNFFKWIDELEYKILSIPKPDLNIFLHMPAEIAYFLIKKREKKEYLKNKKRDIHERDLSHLKQAEKIYLEVAKTFRSDFKTVECVEHGRLLPIQEISEKVWIIVKEFLGINP